MNSGSQEVDEVKVLQLETAAGAAIKVRTTCTKYYRHLSAFMTAVFDVLKILFVAVFCEPVLR